MISLQYRNYLLGMMMLVGVVGTYDRFVFALVLEPIKRDLALSDSQLGLMTGIAFAAFYAIAGIPIARWADRGNRITLVAATTGLLGMMLALCGIVSNFVQLLLVRAGIAIGEAGCMPSAQSLLADYFDRSERPQAMATLLIFYPVSMIVGYLLGGWLVESFGWRGTFMILGIPVLLTALLVKLTLKEPRLNIPVKANPLCTSATKTERKIPSLAMVLKVLWEKPSCRHLLMAFCVSYLFVMGTSQWIATFFIRTHGMTVAELGAWMALSWGVGGIAGNYLGGYLATRYASKNEKLQMRGLAFANIFYGMSSVAAYLSSNQYLALAFIAMSAFFGSLTNGPIFSAIQSLVNENMRSVTIALLFLFANLIGFGLGPLSLGVLSDLLSPSLGQESLRYALVLFSPGVLWVAFHFWKVSETIEYDIEETEFGSSADTENLDRKPAMEVERGV